MFSYSTKRLVAMIIAALIPTLVLLLGIFLLLSGTILNFSFALAWLWAPLFTCGLLGLCIFSELFTSTKKVLVVLVLIVFVVGMYFGLFFVQHEGIWRFSAEEIETEYSLIADRFSPMPSLDEIGNPTNVEYINFFASEFIFSWDAYHLICQYDKETYDEEKQKLDEKYIYQSTPIYDNWDGVVYTCNPSAEIDGYTFRMLSNDYYEHDYPKVVIIVGYCDETKEIIYLTYYDFDRDSITSLEEFILDECGWEHIR